MGFFIHSNTLAIIEFDIHETIFIFWQSKYILQKYYFDGGQKFMNVSYNEWSLQKLKLILLNSIVHNSTYRVLSNFKKKVQARFIKMNAFLK